MFSALLAEEGPVAGEGSDRQLHAQLFGGDGVVAAEGRVVGKACRAGERDEGAGDVAIVGGGEQGGGNRDFPFGAEGVVARAACGARGVALCRVALCGDGLRIRTWRGLWGSRGGTG